MLIEMLCAFYNDDVITECMCQQWLRRFGDKEERIRDQLRSGRPYEFESESMNLESEDK